jgi:beta-glucosidase-like glycosyl hydrolase
MKIYLPAFKKRCSKCQSGFHYVQLQPHQWCFTQPKNKWLMHDMLRTTWGFPFLSMTDWGAAKHSLLMVRDGVDLEMPDAAFMKPDSIKAYLADGKITMQTLDDKVYHILFTGAYFNLFGTVADSHIALDNSENAQSPTRVSLPASSILQPTIPNISAQKSALTLTSAHSMKSIYRLLKTLFKMPKWVPLCPVTTSSMVFTQPKINGSCTTCCAPHGVSPS